MRRRLYDATQRPSVDGRFLRFGSEKAYVRGVTYGTFSTGADGFPYPDPETVEADFEAIAACGANAVRVYTAPPRWLLDTAHDQGLSVMVGLAWEQHVAFLDDKKTATRIVESVREEAAACAGHPAVLCYAVGNEIPSEILRWHGARRVEHFVERLYSTVKEVDRDALVTYVNYPSTEYLQLPFLDLLCFNVYLESSDQFAAYLSRLHNIAGDRPLLITELGLDSHRHGEDEQAAALSRQLGDAYASGCAGAFVFAWTDEWHRGGADVEDWHFGLVDRHRMPKPALRAVEQAYERVPFPRDAPAPKISVVVCTHNGEETLGSCLDALFALDYPDYEVIVVDDGSTDATARIASSYDVRMIRTENRGLSCARNIGLTAAGGEIVAFIDDDAWPDRDWLRYLAHAFASTDHVGVGGPNIAPDQCGLVEGAVARAPGGPIHVLLSDDVAEHIPGCNMAFRRDELQAAGGFDPVFKVAGDDVDICWRMQERGKTIGFGPGAVVRHKRRGSLRSYLKQQLEYGKAEALLERKWPYKYNRGGHLAWAGRVYSGALRHRPGRIGYGTWGSNLFQSLYERTPSTIGTLPLMPEWYLLLAVLAAVSVVGAFEGPLVPWTGSSPVPVELLLLAVAALALAAKSVAAAWRDPQRRDTSPTLRLLTALLYLLQPAARLIGRLRGGLTPWRRRGDFSFRLPRPLELEIWSEDWRSRSERLVDFERSLRRRSMTVVRGGDYDRWDFRMRVGPLAAARVQIAVEEHGNGNQLVRYRAWPQWSRVLPPVVLLLGLWLAAAVVEQSVYLATAIGAALAVILARAFAEAGAALGAVASAAHAASQLRPSAEFLADLQPASVRDLLHLPEHRNGSVVEGVKAPETAEVLEGHG